MFCYPGGGSNSSGKPTYGAPKPKSMGGFHSSDGLPCTSRQSRVANNTILHYNVIAPVPRRARAARRTQTPRCRSRGKSGSEQRSVSGMHQCRESLRCFARLHELKCEGCVLFAFCWQENTIFPPYILTTWEVPFLDSLQNVSSDVQNVIVLM